MKTSPTSRLLLILTLLLLSSGCDKKTSTTKDKHSHSTRLPDVTDNRNDLVLSWFEDAGPQTASSVKDVTNHARKNVRVQDPSIPPEERTPGVVFLADLSRPSAGGKYNVRAVPRKNFDAILAARHPKIQEKTLDPAKQQLIMYATTHCPVCHKARRWLLDKKIPYIEKDIGRDQVAAAALAAKGKAQGVPTSGVPIFEINGRLIPGFDPSVIIKSLSTTDPVQTIPPKMPTDLTI